jgi:CubicO group peptidase (beta-lactamase class C family)
MHWSRAIRAAIIAALLMTSLPAWADAPSASKEITAALQAFVDRGTLAGAVTFVADKDRVLCLNTVGYANIAAHEPMRADTLFWIASQSKPITATALMILVDEGKVSLDDPVAKYLPEFSNQWIVAAQDQDHLLLRKPKHVVTIRHLLSHTSGMPFRSEMEQPTLDQLRLRDAVRSYAMTPLLFEPGSKYQYSNAGINTAGRIIEVVTGRKYEDFLQDRLFEPLGMRDTTFWPNAAQLHRLATSYKPSADKMGLEATTITQLEYPLDDHNRQPVPAGGLFSTADDLGKFCRMILNGGTLGGRRYLSQRAVREMTKKQTGAALKDEYGLGWATGSGTFGHGGAYATDMTIDRKPGLIMVFMVQHAGFPGNGGQSRAAFQKAAEAEFGKSR